MFRQKSHKKTLLIENSLTNDRSLDRGIPRVTRKIIDYSHQVCLKNKINCHAIKFAYGRYWIINLNNNDHSMLAMPIFLILKIGDWIYQTVKFLSNCFKTEESETSPKQTPSSNKKSHKNIILKLLDLAEIFLNAVVFYLDVITFKYRWINITHNHIILLSDPNIDNSSQYSFQKKLKATGVTIIPIIHDLIPLTHSQYCSDYEVNKFKGMLKHHLLFSSGYLTVSQYTKKELSKYIVDNNFSFAINLPIHVTYLGCEILPEQENTDLDSLNTKFIKINFHEKIFLIVGALDARKDFLTAIEAFNKLWLEDNQFQLVIIGRGDENYQNQIKSNQFFNQFLFYFGDVNDEELNWFYQQTDVLIFPSRAEGFGLPLVEAMHFNKAVIASDLDVFKEIAGDWPTYFKTGDVDHLYLTLKTYQFQDSVPSAQWINWHQSTTQIIDSCLRIADSNAKIEDTKL